MSSRRATLGPVSSSSANIAAGSASSRQSLGGRFAPISKSNSRKSLAPSSSSSTSAAASGAATARPASARMSMGPSMNSRQSLGGNRNAMTDRRSGGRPSSIGARGGARGMAGPRSDPRPLSDKAFMKENIRKLIVYLTAHNYEHVLSPQQLISPTVKDFRNILHFLLRQWDPNFKFEGKGGVLTMGLGFEDMVKFWMKRFGYPFNISKSALQAAGSPHTWPSLLAMLVWLVESLTYHELVHGPNGAAQETDTRMLFEYVSSTYLSFLQGEDNFTAQDEALAQKFNVRNHAVAEEVRKYEQRIAEAEGVIAGIMSKEQLLADTIAFRNACQGDVPVLENNIRDNQAYLQNVRERKEARAAELENQNALLAQAQAELAELQLTLSKQTFTPLQVQEMMHQKSSLEASLEAQAKQQESVQSEIWAREGEVARKAQQVEEKVGAFNEASQQLEEATQSLGGEGAAGEGAAVTLFSHSELRFIPNAETAAQMLSLDLKAHKESVAASKESLQLARKAAAQELKAQAPPLVALQELESERAGSVDALAKRSAKIHDLYSTERGKMHRAGEVAIAAVEDVELQLVTLRNTLAAMGGSAMVDRAHAHAQSLDEQLAALEAQQMEAEGALKQEVCSAMQILTEHKLAITARLEEMLGQAQAVKAAVDGMEVA